MELATRLRDARVGGQLSLEQKTQPQGHQRVPKTEELLQQVRVLGRYPKESKRDVVERQLAEKLRRARNAMQFSPEQEAELKALRQE